MFRIKIILSLGDIYIQDVSVDTLAEAQEIACRKVSDELCTMKVKLFSAKDDDYVVCKQDSEWMLGFVRITKI